VHPAPPVRVTLGRSAVWIASNAVLGGASAASLVAWPLMKDGTLAIAWAVIVAGAVGAAFAGTQAWRRQARAELSWDGSGWQWAGNDGDVRVMIDLDRWMLLRVERPAKGRCWVAASRRAAEGPWPALRAALHSRRPASPLTGAPPV
jgi:hypothetical protein